MHNVSRVSDPYFHTLRKILLQMPAAHCWHKGGKYRRRSSCEAAIPRRRSSVVKGCQRMGQPHSHAKSTIGEIFSRWLRSTHSIQKMTEENNRVVILFIYIYIIVTFPLISMLREKLYQTPLITWSCSSFTCLPA